MRKNIKIGDRFGRLNVIKKTDERRRGRIVWECECECTNLVNVTSTDLLNGDTQSCGCIKKELEEKHLRNKYEEKRVDGVAMHLFDDKARKDSSTGYRGISKYYTRVSKEERYRAWITVKGKRYYKSGFLTAKDAYYKGRIPLEKEHLPKNNTEGN